LRVERVEDRRCRHHRSRTGATSAADDVDDLVRALWVTCAGEDQAKTGAAGIWLPARYHHRGAPLGQDLTARRDKLSGIWGTQPMGSAKQEGIE
jgi:hypothetical protein